MKPLINLDEVDHFKEHGDGSFQEKYAEIDEKIGAQKLGYSITILSPGKMVCPFHNHRVNEEMFLVLEGTGTLRFGETQYPIKTHDIIACPPGGRDVAHQIINTSDSDLRYLCLSTKEPMDICEYPDSDKMLAYAGDSEGGTFRHIFKLNDEVDYFLDEK